MLAARFSPYSQQPVQGVAADLRDVIHIHGKAVGKGDHTLLGIDQGKLPRFFQIRPARFPVVGLEISDRDLRALVQNPAQADHFRVELLQRRLIRGAVLLRHPGGFLNELLIACQRGKRGKLSRPVLQGHLWPGWGNVMGQVDDILGGGSSYKVEDLVVTYSYVPMTEEDREAVISDLYEKDRVAGGYARLFSDYVGIDIGIMPVFVAAALVSADRRKRVSDLIYTRKISSLKLIFTRYAALVTMMFIPVILCMIAAAIQLIKYFDFNDLALYKMFTLPTFWLLPQLMIVTAVAMIVTEVFSSGIAILLQFAWWFSSIMASGAKLSGSISKFDLVCRHNTVFGRDEFMLSRNDFIFNRVFFFITAIVITAITAYVYELKRGGRFHGIRLFGKDSIFRHKA